MKLNLIFWITFKFCIASKFPAFIKQTWKRTPYLGFWLARKASGLRQIKRLHESKSQCFWVTFKFWFYAAAPNSQIYFGNLEPHPFCGFWRARRAPGMGQIKKFHKTQSIWVSLKFMFLSRPPTFQLLLSQPGNGPLFRLLMSPLGLQAASNEKLTPKVIVFCHLKFLFTARPPNSQLLFSKPGNRPLFEDFDRPVVPWGSVKSKSWIKQWFIDFDFSGGPFNINFDIRFSP